MTGVAAQGEASQWRSCRSEVTLPHFSQEHIHATNVHQIMQVSTLKGITIVYTAVAMNVYNFYDGGTLYELFDWP